MCECSIISFAGNIWCACKYYNVGLSSDDYSTRKSCVIDLTLNDCDANISCNLQYMFYM